MDTADRQRMTAAEYLDWERDQAVKHEFHRGEVFAMADGSPRHNFLAAAISGELRHALRDGSCKVLSSDQRIMADDGERYVYADVVAVCAAVETMANARDVLTNPSIVVEVLSPSTEAYDRGSKWAAYQRLASLSDYLLVHQPEARIEHYRRESRGIWRFMAAQAGETVVLSGGVLVSVDAVYRGAFDLADG